MEWKSYFWNQRKTYANTYVWVKNYHFLDSFPYCSFRTFFIITNQMNSCFNMTNTWRSTCLNFQMNMLTIKLFTKTRQENKINLPIFIVVSLVSFKRLPVASAVFSAHFTKVSLILSTWPRVTATAAPVPTVATAELFQCFK